MSWLLFHSCRGCRKDSLYRSEHICLDTNIEDVVRIYFHKAFDQIDQVCVDIIMTESAKLSGIWGYFTPPVDLQCHGWKWNTKTRETVQELLKGIELYQPNFFVTMGYNSLYESMAVIAEPMEC